MITVEGLTHYYGERRAIEDIRFQISANEIVGFLGLNGAGKSTTLRILAGLLVPSAGSITIDGVDLVAAGASSRARIGYLPEDPPLYREMTVREFVAYCGELKGLDAATVQSRLDGVLKVAQLTHVQHRVIQELSHGYRKRCGIAQAIIHKPKLVILDEPISGLDPRQIVEMRQVIRDLAKDCTVLISSHILGEISETCDRILVLAGGRIVAQGTEAELAARAGGEGARLTLLLRGSAAAIDAALASGVPVLSYDKHEEAGGIWRVHVALASDDREALVAALVRGGVGIRKVVEDESELEQIFLGLTQGSIRMKGILLVARRDFWAYINTHWGWAILALALLLDGLLFNVFALTGTAQYSADVLDKFVLVTGGITLAASVFITMRLFAEERQTGTIVLLDSSPLSEGQIVLGKYLSGMAFLTLFAALTFYMPAMIFVNGKVSPEQIAVGYLGILLLGSAGVAIGTWASAISRNQLLAGVISAVVVVFFVVCWMLARVLDPPFKAVISYVAFFDKQLQPFQEGRIDTQGVFFFVSLTFAFLLLANRSLIARRWE